MRLEIDRLDKVGEAFRSRSSYIQSKVNKYGSELAADIDQRYEGGHIVGDQFGGPPEEINTVAMLEEVNQTRVGKESKRLIHGVYVNMSPRMAVMVSGKVSGGLV